MSLENSSTQSISDSLLARLRSGDSLAWQRLVSIFGPLVYHWSRAAQLGPADSADIVQDVFQRVFVGLDAFRYERREDSFRGWLAVIARNRIRDHYRQLARQTTGRGGSDFQQMVASQANEDSASSMTLLGDGEFNSPRQRALAVRRAAESLRNEFEAKTWEMFWRTTVEEESPADVATSLGLQVTAVYKAKSRVLKRLREMLDAAL